MAKNNKLLYIAGAVGLGIVGYFGYTWYKNRQTTSNNNPPPPPPPLDSEPTLGSSTPSSSTSSSSTQSVSNPFKTKAEVVAFQQYVINTKNDKTILGQGGSTGFGDDGNWGPKTSKAWTKYGADYLKSIGSSSGSTPGLSTEVKNNIDVIVRQGQGEKAQRSYLESTAKNYPAFVNNWATAIKKRLETGGKQGTTFVFANQVYNSYNAKKELQTTAIGKKAIVKDGVNNATVRWYAKWDSPTKPANKDLGKVEGMFYNRNDKALFLYVPKNIQGSTHKWIFAQNVNLQ